MIDADKIIINESYLDNANYSIFQNHEQIFNLSDNEIVNTIPNISKSIELIDFEGYLNFTTKNCRMKTIYTYVITTNSRCPEGPIYTKVPYKTIFENGNLYGFEVMEYFSNTNSAAYFRSLVHITFISDYIDNENSKLKENFKMETQNLSLKYLVEIIMKKYSVKKDIENELDIKVENPDSNENPSNLEEFSSNVIYSFGFFHLIEDKLHSIKDKNLFVTKNNYDSIDLDFYYSQAEEILKMNNITSREAVKKEEDDYKEDKEDNLQNDLLNELLEFVDNNNEGNKN